MPFEFSAQDEEILTKKAQDDPHAFRELYQVYLPRIYAYVAHRVNSSHDTEDLVSEAFLKAVEQMNRFVYRGNGSFSAWLFRIAHNIVADYYRKRRHRQERIDSTSVDAAIDDSVSPDAKVVLSEESARLHQMIRTLPLRRQEVISLRFFGGLRNRQIAQVLGINERSVASHLCRAIEDLQRKYAEAEPQRHLEPQHHERKRG